MTSHLGWKHRPGMLPEQVVIEAREPDEREVAIRPTLVGLCGTDRGIVAGTYPGTHGVVLGHEGVGIVEQVGSGVPESLLGQRVAINPTLWCGRCGACRAGRTNSCADKAAWEIGVSRDGLLQQLCVLPARALHAVPADMPDRAVVMIEPLACVMHGLNRVSPQSGQDALVMGGGPIGCVTALALASRTGCSVAIGEIDPYRRDFLKTEFGMTVTDEPQRSGTYDLVVDTVGNQLETSLSLVRTGGTVLVMGCRNDATALIKPLELIARQVSVAFSCDYDAAVFPQAITEARALPVARVITDELPLQQVDDAFRLLGVGAPGEDQYRGQKVAIMVS